MKLKLIQPLFFLVAIAAAGCGKKPAGGEAQAGEPWAESVREWMDAAEVLPEATPQELLAALAQAEAAQRQQEAAAVLGRL